MEKTKNPDDENVRFENHKVENLDEYMEAK